MSRAWMFHFMYIFLSILKIIRRNGKRNNRTKSLIAHMHTFTIHITMRPPFFSRQLAHFYCERKAEETAYKGGQKIERNEWGEKERNWMSKCDAIVSVTLSKRKALQKSCIIDVISLILPLPLLFSLQLSLVAQRRTTRTTKRSEDHRHQQKRPMNFFPENGYREQLALILSFYFDFEVYGFSHLSLDTMIVSIRWFATESRWMHKLIALRMIVVILHIVVLSGSNWEKELTDCIDDIWKEKC